MNNLLRRVLQRRAPTPVEQISERYVTAAPSPQNALDIFRGEWTSRLPKELPGLHAGEIPLFEDDRVRWAIGQFGDVQGKSVLELGPLEGGHSYMLERAGFGSVLGIEGNTRAYLKCLVVKEVVGLSRTRYLCGDIVEYLRETPPQFNAVLASGVLYHMAEPLELLGRLSAITDRMYIWTHYHDPALMNRHAARFKGQEQREYDGFTCPVFYQEYAAEATAWSGFCGGPRRYSRWMRHDDILGALEHFGFSVTTNFEQPEHPNGPAFGLVAMR